MLTESLFIDYIFKTDEGMYDKEKDKLMNEMKTHLSLYTQEDFKDFIDCFFDERASDDIDFDYISKVGSSFAKYVEEVQKQVDSHTQTFGYLQMDTLDQAIFLL